MAVRTLKTGTAEFKIPNYSRNLDKIFDEAQITGELNLCGRKLKEYPKTSKYNLRDVLLADLSKNRFSELPTEVCEYVSLEKLYLYNNAIKSLTDSLASLHYLTHLILSRNQLTNLPSSVCHLPNLKVLDVSGNRLVSLPEELGLLSKLTVLDASYNQLQHLPPSLGDLDELSRLELRRNHLQQVPTEICFLHLSAMDLSYNRISSLPTELRFMSTLLTLLLDANPLIHPPAHVCSRGRVHIFKWLDHSATKEDKKRALSEEEFRQTRKPAVPPLLSDLRLVNGLLDEYHKRSTLDSGYSTSESSDNRWSHGSQELFEPVRAPEPVKEIRLNHPNQLAINGNHYNNGFSEEGLTGDFNGTSKSNGSGSATEPASASSTPSTLSPGDHFNLEDEFHKAMKIRQEANSNSKSSLSINLMDSDGCSSPHASAGRNNDAYQIPSSNSSNHSPLYPQSTDPSLPHNPDPGGGFVPSPCAPPLRSSHAHVHTYREYLEAKRQQRALESNNIYKRQCSENSNFSDQSLPQRMEDGLSSPTHVNRPPLRSTTNGSVSTGNLNTRNSDETIRDLNRATVKSIQKEAVLSYIKARVSPSKSLSPSSPNASFDSSDGPPFPYSNQHNSHMSNSSSPMQGYNLASSYSGTNGSALLSSSSKSSSVHRIPSSTSTNSTPSPSSLHPKRSQSISSDSSSDVPPNVLKSRKKSGGGKPFEPDFAPHLNFTYRRELEKQQHEKQLIENLREIIETRLKVSLPSDLSSALMDGVVLCHLVNHVRPRAVSSIHVPSPVVPKLTIAKCRLNVENFLEACRRIGVEEELLCTCDDIVTHFAPERVLTTVRSLLLSPPDVLLISNGTCHTSFSINQSLPLDSMNSQKPLSTSSSSLPSLTSPVSRTTLSLSDPTLPSLTNDGATDKNENDLTHSQITDKKGIHKPTMDSNSNSIASDKDRFISNVLLCVFLVSLLLLAMLPSSDQT